MFYILENKYKHTKKWEYWTAIWEVRRPFKCFAILVSEIHGLVSEKSGKSQGILFTQSAGNPGIEFNMIY